MFVYQLDFSPVSCCLKTMSLFKLVGESSHRFLTNRINLFENVPVNECLTWRRCSTSFIYPPLTCINHHHQFTIWNLWHFNFIICRIPAQWFEKVINNLSLFSWQFDIIVINWKQDCQYCIFEATCILTCCVNWVHLKIISYTVYSMFRSRVEMKLLWVK